MNISVEKLLNKMEEKIREAKETGSDSVIRERIHAIKTMCELILEESSTVSTSVSKNSSLPVTTSLNTRQGQISVTSPIGQERLIIDEESNGESIFDF